MEAAAGVTALEEGGLLFQQGMLLEAMENIDMASVCGILALQVVGKKE